MMRKVVECDMGEDSSIQYYFWWCVCDFLSSLVPSIPTFSAHAKTGALLGDTETTSVAGPPVRFLVFDH